MKEHEEEWQDIISRRLINRAETAGGELVEQDDEPIPPPERGEDAPAIEDTFDALQAPFAAEGAADLTVIDAKLSATAFAKVEKSLASLGFFTPSSRRVKSQRIKRIGFTRELEGKRVEVTAEILPTIFGLPITADQDKYLALQEIITDIIQTKGQVTNPIRFTSAELLRLLNKRVRTGKNYKEIAEWLDVMSSTTIVSNGVVYVSGQKRFARDRFHVFERAVSVGKELEDGTIADANYVWLSKWQLDNINNHYLLPIDLETYRKLKNHIAKALVPLLQIWLYASHRAGSFEKRYDELCEILSLQMYKAPSLITRQLKPSLDELVDHEYLENWRIEKTSDRNAYKIIFFHGSKFHRDRRKRVSQKTAAEAPVVIAQSKAAEPNLPEPGRLRPTPASNSTDVPQKQRGRPKGGANAPAPEASTADAQSVVPATAHDHTSALLDELVTRGLMASVAMKLLHSLSSEHLDQVSDYIEYWDSVKATREVGPGFLYDLVRQGDPLPTTFETSRRRRAREEKARRHSLRLQVEQALESRHEEHCREAVNRYIAEELPKDEYERLLEAKRRELRGGGGGWLSQYLQSKPPEMLEEAAHAGVRTEIAKRLPTPSFGEYRREEQPRLLADMGLTPADLDLEQPGLDDTTSTPAE